jgi:hypothetical protein
MPMLSRLLLKQQTKMSLGSATESKDDADIELDDISPPQPIHL